MNKEKGDFIRKGKSCGCLIASNVIALEIEKRKKNLMLKNLKERIAHAKNKKIISNLKRKRKEMINSIRQVHKRKTGMRGRFEEYVKKSGYRPPKFKKKR